MHVSSITAPTGGQKASFGGFNFQKTTGSKISKKEMSAVQDALLRRYFCGNYSLPEGLVELATVSKDYVVNVLVNCKKIVMELPHPYNSEAKPIEVSFRNTFSKKVGDSVKTLTPYLNAMDEAGEKAQKNWGKDTIKRLERWLNREHSISVCKR